MKHQLFPGLPVAVVIFFLLPFGAYSQGTAFSYQGVLDNNGVPANGNFDLTFTLFNTNITGSAVAGPVTNTAVAVSNGLFTATVDFGAAFTGANMWIEIAARTNGSGSFISLAPRQQVTPSPYAILAGNVSAGGVSAGVYGKAVSFTNAQNSFAGAFTGDGSGLANVSGTLPWQSVAATAIQVAPNTGYIITNTAQTVTLTLPASPSIGDRVAISCPGYGWRLAQNAGQSILGQSILGAAALWIQSLAPSPTTQYLLQVVSSPDGNHLAAAGTANGEVWVSNDRGASWNGVGLTGGYVCLSADGRYVFYVGSGAGIFQSSDFGTNFSFPYPASMSWRNIACSSNGAYATAVVAGGGIYISSNYGTNWSPSGAASNHWAAVNVSADGSHQTALVLNGQVYNSTDYGTNWTLASGSPTTSWSCIAGSTDGSRLVAGSTGTQIYLSADYGATWTQASTPGAAWEAVASSGDGTRLAAASGTTPVLISTDSGATWNYATMPSLPTPSWRGLGSAAGGTLAVTEADGGGVYLRPLTTTVGTAGYLTGGQATALELQYVGNGEFLPLNNEGTLLAH